MFRRYFCLPLAVAAALSAVIAVPARAGDNLVQKKSVTGPNGRYGSVERYSDLSGGKVYNWVRLTADDNDGPGGKCTETWVDYSTKPHVHWNPGVFVNCNGGKRSVSPAMTNNGKTIVGIGIVVCEVPNTSGRIVRNSSNCRGQLGAMYLHSGQSYSSFAVTADQHPDGIQVYKA